VIYFVEFGVVLLIVVGIVKAAIGRRYEDMTEEEFEAEAKRRSSLGAAVGSVQNIFEFGHTNEYIVEQQDRIEADGSDSGDRPKAGSAPKN
jgi:hypothetical protein